ncbi:hypothetical protein [Halobacteriovorax sp. JY17]|uniref:hypothetical protein n=1 Tax=Halobacteriovorax sp. JY17 TaxID=2014617 RepID=UPI000C52341B|nr:hypothetical protein [Halobacteriovorax sp. JY17]PIK15321.1 MAG: hypothetical protein CES88_01000 [Halobacteriovorax sp. JY17]
MLKYILLINLILLFSCSHTPERIIYQNKLEKHPLSKLSAWQWSNNRNIETKVTSQLTGQEEELLEILKGAHSLYSPHNLIKSEIASQNFQHVFRYSLLSLPKELKIFLNKHLKRIFLVKGLGVSTLTIQLHQSEKVNSGQFISFLDIDVLNQKINDWYKWRESTAFKADSSYTFSPYLSHENTVVDTSQMALSYLVAIILNWNPNYFPTSKENYFLAPEKYQFLNQSWKLTNGIVTPKRDDLNEDLHYLRYYSKGEPLFSNKDQPKFYQELESTNFINLFSLMGSSKDFIESFANYIYVEKLEHPFSIDFFNNGELTGSFGSCWQQVRCQQKKKVIESILKKEVYSIND